MAPKKRKAGPATVATLPTRGKRFRLGSSSVLGEDAEVTASGRPKRSTAGDLNYDQTRRRSRSGSTPIPVKQESNARKPAAIKPEVAKRGRGRPRKSVSASPALSKKPNRHDQVPNPAPNVEVPAKQRGRPKKPVLTKPEASNSAKAFKPAAINSKAGRTKRSGGEVTLDGDSTGAVVQEADWESALESEHELQGEAQFWLMKAEPESRIEKGQDVKFSIDDLMSRTEPEGWDGVRNFVARNNMRAMRKGDLAFFYHSNCSVPGVAGIMQIVREHSVDESAFDENHPYYDAKSDRSKPKWELVHVKGLRKFADLVTLKTLREHSGAGKALENMQALKQSRLSVSSVTQKEWNFIMDLSGEKFEDFEAADQVEAS